MGPFVARQHRIRFSTLIYWQNSVSSRSTVSGGIDRSTARDCLGRLRGGGFDVGDPGC
jgi:hypothetical protein